MFVPESPKAPEGGLLDQGKKSAWQRGQVSIPQRSVQ